MSRVKTTLLLRKRWTREIWRLQQFQHSRECQRGRRRVTPCRIDVIQTGHVCPSQVIQNNAGQTIQDARKSATKRDGMSAVGKVSGEATTDSENIITKNSNYSPPNSESVNKSLLTDSKTRRDAPSARSVTHHTFSTCGSTAPSVHGKSPSGATTLPSDELPARHPHLTV